MLEEDIVQSVLDNILYTMHLSIQTLPNLGLMSKSSKSILKYKISY